jgi:hypothetical protein
MNTTTINNPKRPGRKPANKAKRIESLLAKGYPPQIVAKKVQTSLQYVYTVKAKLSSPVEPLKVVEVPAPTVPLAMPEMAVYAPPVHTPKPTLWARFRDWIGV